MRLHLHIDELALEGLRLTQHQGSLVRSAIERELARRLLAGGLGLRTATGGASPLLQAASVEAGHAGDPANLGAQVAASVHGAVQGLAGGRS